MLRRFVLIVCGILLGGPALLRADLTSPVLVQPIPAQSLGRAGSTQQVDLHTYLQDPNVPGTAVRMTVQAGTLVSGNINIALTDSQTPVTVANFLAYINAGYYANNIVHRSMPGFVIQGGEYIFQTVNQPANSLGFIPTFAAIQNEPGISNVRGTIAMAKLSGNANSATDQWFINLSDTNTFLDDAANGAFTVFGRVLGSGMAVADAIAALPTYNGTSIAFDWTDIPLTNTTVGNATGFFPSAFVVTSTAVVPAVTYAASSSNTSLVTTSISGNTLTLTPSSANIGSANITVTATDLLGAQLQANFTVTVLDTYANWQAGFSFGNVTLAGETANPDSDNLSNLAEYAFGGDPVHAQAVTGAPKAESGGGVTFYIRQQAALSYEVDVSADLSHWTKVWQSSDGFAASAVFSRTVLSGFDQLVIRYPGAAPGNPYFWRVQVTRSL